MGGGVQRQRLRELRARAAAATALLLTAAAGPASRRVIVSAPAGDGRAATQERILHEAAPAMRDRDVVIERAVRDGAFAVILVGRDGGEKRRWSAPVAAATIEAAIDAMPMRRAEMRGGKD